MAGGAGRLTSEPRPVLVVQSDLFVSAGFVTVAPVTSTRVASPTRVAMPATPATGLEREAWVMADKLQTAPRANLQTRSAHPIKGQTSSRPQFWDQLSLWPKTMARLKGFEPPTF
ncbi:MAG: type II toxin-antitoxin system PemK/MazF family toxin [Bifidobacteriaceae bacterium]|nr:type II toxin-antitoxin system PemK/MazF family toxin [Bifidobacteriaceae bacterium]